MKRAPREPPDACRQWWRRRRRSQTKKDIKKNNGAREKKKTKKQGGCGSRRQNNKKRKTRQPSERGTPPPVSEPMSSGPGRPAWDLTWIRHSRPRARRLLACSPPSAAAAVVRKCHRCLLVQVSRASFAPPPSQAKAGTPNKQVVILRWHAEFLLREERGGPCRASPRVVLGPWRARSKLGDSDLLRSLLLKCRPTERSGAHRAPAGDCAGLVLPGRILAPHPTPEAAAPGAIIATFCQLPTGSSHRLFLPGGRLRKLRTSPLPPSLPPVGILPTHP